MPILEKLKKRKFENARDWIKSTSPLILFANYRDTTQTGIETGFVPTTQHYPAAGICYDVSK